METKKRTTKKTTMRGTKGDGSVFQTNDKQWRGKIAACVETGGRIKYFSGKSRAEVTRKMREFRLTMRPGIPPPPEKYFDDYIKNWLYSIKFNQLKPTSFDRIESTVDTHIIPRLGNYKLAEITPDIIQLEVINRMQQTPSTATGKKTLSYSSIKKAHDILNECFNYALVRNQVISNPMKQIVMPRKDKFEEKEIKFFTEEEVERFVAACQSKSIPGTYPYQYGPIFIIMLYTGLRLGEMLKLCWKDVDLKKRRLYVKGNIVAVKDRSENQYDDIENGIKLSRITIEQKSTKTKSGMNRAVPINTKALQAFLILDEMNKSSSSPYSPYVVKSKNGSITTMSALQKPYDKVLDLAGIEHCGFHSLRHTFASLLFKKGIDVKIVSEILGHSNTSITYNTYVHIINEQKRVAIDLLDDI